jgi:hypothetical protein
MTRQEYEQLMTECTVKHEPKQPQPKDPFLGQVARWMAKGKTLDEITEIELENHGACCGSARGLYERVEQRNRFRARVARAMEMIGELTA